MERENSLKLEKQVKSEVKQIKTFLLFGLALLILAVLFQVTLAVIPFYFYWLYSGVEDPMFGSISFGLIAAVIILGYIFRGFIFDFSKPDGVQVSEESKLKELVKDLAQKVNAPCPDKIFLTDDFNAGVSTYKSYSHPIGEHYLSIGLPYLAAVSHDELKSVIAHELGHLSKEHTGFSRFIYRVYNGLNKIDYVLNNSPGYLDRLYHKGLNLYLKKLNKLSYATLRTHEFQADAIAAKVTSNEVTATLLCRTEIISDWINDTYWKKIWRDSWKSAYPPKDIIKNACNVILRCNEGVMEKYFDVSKLKKTKEGDTHPSLCDRVKILGQKVKVPELINQEDRSINILGNDKEKLIETCDSLWQEEILEEWQDYHYYMSEAVMRRDMLQKLKSQRTLLIGEKIEYAQLLGKTLGQKQKLKELLSLNKEYKSNSWILLEILDTLYELRDNKVIQVAKVIIKSGTLSNKLRAYRVLAKHFSRKGDEEKVLKTKEKIKQLEAISKKRDDYKKPDYRMHELPKNKVEQIEKWLKTVGDIDFALICKTEDKSESNSPLHHLFISTPCYLNMDLSNVIWSGLDINVDCHVIDADYHEKTTKFLLEKMPEARIFGDAKYYL